MKSTYTKRYIVYIGIKYMASKTIYTLNIGNYCPEITEMTYPLMKKYARKIGAEFFEITERKSPEFSFAYEKFQIYQLGREHENEWNIFMDPDFLIHPDFPDITVCLDRDKVCFIGTPPASERFRFDEYLEADGRNIAVPMWFNIVSSDCLDLWHPLDDMTQAEAISHILPIPAPSEYEVIRPVIERLYPEFKLNLEPHRFIDDYVASRNLAKYRLKYCSLEIRMDLFFHLPLSSNPVKIHLMRNLLKGVGVNGNKVPLWDLRGDEAESKKGGVI